jgi:PAS domain-containing protein
LAGETVRFETRIMYPTGTRDIDVIYVPQRDAAGVVEGFVALVNDVTELKAGEGAKPVPRRSSGDAVVVARL